MHQMCPCVSDGNLAAPGTVLTPRVVADVLAMAVVPPWAGAPFPFPLPAPVRSNDLLTFTSLTQICFSVLSFPLAKCSCHYFGSVQSENHTVIQDYLKVKQ